MGARRILLVGLLHCGPLAAQTVVESHQQLAFDRPEAWAMAHLGAATLFPGLGVAQPRRAGSWGLGVELGSMPHLSPHRRRVGFDGTKLEDLNKSPLFGRLRGTLGLPQDTTLELAWTPPIEIGGARARSMYGLALERPWLRRDRWQSSVRIHYHRGRVTGDITCDRRTAAQAPGSPANPFGCRAPSSDRYTARHYGVEASLGLVPRARPFAPFASLAYVHMDLHTQVDAEVFSVIDRSTLATRGNVWNAGLGLAGRSGTHWDWALALAWTPLDVRRPPRRAASSDDLWSLRLMLSRVRS